MVACGYPEAPWSPGHTSSPGTPFCAWPTEALGLALPRGHCCPWSWSTHDRIWDCWQGLRGLGADARLCPGDTLAPHLPPCAQCPVFYAGEPPAASSEIKRLALFHSVSCPELSGQLKCKVMRRMAFRRTKRPEDDGRFRSQPRRATGWRSAWPQRRPSTPSQAGAGGGGAAVRSLWLSRKCARGSRLPTHGLLSEPALLIGSFSHLFSMLSD